MSHLLIKVTMHDDGQTELEIFPKPDMVPALFSLVCADILRVIADTVGCDTHDLMEIVLDEIQNPTHQTTTQVSKHDH